MLGILLKISKDSSRATTRCNVAEEACDLTGIQRYVTASTADKCEPFLVKTMSSLQMQKEEQKRLSKNVLREIGEDHFLGIERRVNMFEGFLEKSVYE